MSVPDQPQPPNTQPTIPAARSGRPTGKPVVHPTPAATRQAQPDARRPLSYTQIEAYYRRARDYYNRSPRLQRAVYQKKFTPAFWTVASLISLTINLILISVVLILGRQLFTLRSIVAENLVGGLYENFVLMDQAHIRTNINVNSTIQVQDEIAVVFDLPLKQNTRVVLTQDTPVSGATIYLNGAPVPLNIVLPSGTPLDIKLDLVVPVSTTVPVVLDVPINLVVPVDIPLEETELHAPFVGLQQVVQPYHMMLSETPAGWREIEACDHWYTRWLCDFFFVGE